MGAKDSKLALGPLEGKDVSYASQLHRSWIASGAGFLLTPEDVATLLEISAESAQVRRMRRARASPRRGHGATPASNVTPPHSCRLSSSPISALTSPALSPPPSALRPRRTW